MTPIFAHGHLRLYLLSLLAESPRHGYELIQALSDRFGGTYSPSAGTIYPRLAKLEEEGLVTKTADGRKTIYAITDAGRTELAGREGELNDIEEGLTDSVRRLADNVRAGVNDAMKSLRADLASAARQARQESKSAPPTPPTPPTAKEQARQASAAALREAELVINSFRQELRTELRVRATRGSVSDETVDELRNRLKRVREEILASLDR